MANLKDDFRKKIQDLESNFSVSCNIFKEFVPMFCKIFIKPNETDIGCRHRNRKQRSPPCTPAQLFEFCWLLLVTVKAKDVDCSVDLVISYHLLLACCDLIFKNALADNRKDLLNKNFEGLPENWSSPNYQYTQAPCIIDKVCISYTLTDAKYVKHYSFKSLIKSLFDKKILVGNTEDFTEILTPTNFETNFNNLSRVYQTYVLQKGDFDERIFLAEYRRRFILRQHSFNNTNGTAHYSVEKDAAKITFGEDVMKVPDTPLTNRQYLGPKENNNSSETPMNENQNVKKLQSLITGRSSGPSPVLQEILNSCSTNPTEKIETIIKTLSEKFATSYVQETNYTNSGLEAAKTLFYRFLESILVKERILNTDISRLVEQNRFYECLFTCSLEIVIFSYNSQRRFPWILNALEISPFYFIRVIELIVRLKDLNLSREMVKHLNTIEEIILGSEMWKSDCVFWEELKKLNNEISKFEDIALPGNMIYGDGKPNQTQDNKNPLQSPGPSAVDQFDSPLSGVKKQLFPNIKPGQSLLQNQNQKTPLQFFIEANPQPLQTPSPQRNDLQQKPKKTGGFNIIFRKVYHLTGVRMEHLCNQLGIMDDELKCKIFTAFEHSLIHATDLFKDRHLDQLLMCAVYIICKVTANSERTFTQIMQSYKTQPQAHSYIYRNVLLYRKNEKDENGAIRTENSQGDLIQFYNNIYVKQMTSFAGRFSSNPTLNTIVPLSPMPFPKALMSSPIHQISKNVFIKSHESPSNNTLGGNKSYNYYFSRSNSKDLTDINRAINNNRSRKRLLGDNNSFEIFDNQKRLCSNRKVQTLLEERRNQNTE